MAYHAHSFAHPLMQVPGRAVTDSLPRFSWNKVFNWQQLGNDLIEVAIILAVAFFVYRGVQLLVRRLVAIKIDEEDPLVRRMREQRAQTLGSLFTNVALIFVATITVLTVLSVLSSRQSMWMTASRCPRNTLVADISGILRRRIVESARPTARREPSGLKLNAVIQPSLVSTRATGSRDSRFHTTARASSSPEASRFPSNDSASDQTGAS